jgi:hypothetical protein
MVKYSYQDYPAAFRRYNTQYPDAEIVGWTLYDTLTYTSGTTVSLVFFNAVRATIDLSNMETAGQLAPPKAFLCRAISVYFKIRPESTAVPDAPDTQAGAVGNLVQLVNSGVLQLQVGNKIYAEYPLWALCSGGGPYGVLAVVDIGAGQTIAGGEVDFGTLGVPDAKNLLTLPKPLFIAPGINFQATITWPTALTLTRNLPIQVALDGEIIRPVQ